MPSPLLFCSNEIVPSICKFRDAQPRVCCCFCPIKWECHAEQAKLAAEGATILPCVELDASDDDMCIDCDWAT